MTVQGEIRPGYKQTEVGVIPEDWDAKALGEIAALYQPTTISAHQLKPSGYPVYGANGIVGFFDRANHDTWQNTITCRGSTCGTVNRTVEKCWITGNAMVVNADANKKLEKEFLFQALKAQDFTLCITGSGQPQIVRGPLQVFPIAVPRLIEEQRAIAAALSDADALIAALEGMIAKKRDLKQAAMQHLLTGKTRLPGFSGKWEVKRLGDVAILHKGQVVPGSQPDTLFCHFSLPAFDNWRKPVLETGSEIGSNKFTVPSNSVLVSKLNPRIPRVWSLCSVPENSVASTEFLVLLPKESLSLGFLSVLCGSTVFCEKMENAVTGTTGSHQRVAPRDAMRLEVDFPTDLNEQTAIAEVLSDMDADLAALEAQVAKARAIKQGMMQELLTGKVRLV